MTEKQRNNGRAITLLIMVIIILIGMFSSCTPQLYKNQINVTHVLALTEEGDTIKIPINAIKPNVIYNVIGYDYYRPYYYNRWNLFNTFNDPHYHPSTFKPRPNNSTRPSFSTNNSMGSSGSVGNSGGNPAVVTPPPNPVISNPKKNN
jgi:hypothetical protein